MNDTDRRVTFRLSAADHDKLRKISFEKYTPVNKLIIEAVKAYLKEKNQAVKPS